LGAGGMGSVYKAQDTRLQRFVALKLLRKELSADPAEAARLEQEARVTAAVNHPNVVQVYSSGTAHGQIYLVMELVDHGSLDDLMAQQPKLPERQVLEAGIQVAKGLRAAHDKGLIHRDVKPANILFSDPQTAKIGDFGLAVAAGQKAEAQNEIWGTPYYVAPERLNNAPEDFRSDIFSLGATLFHAIAGRPPMEGETTSATELRRLKSNPPALRTIAPHVSRETARVIDRMLAPDPANRFTSYSELIEQLQRALDALPPDGARRRGLRSPRVLLLAAGAVILALGAAGAYYTVQKRRAAEAARMVAATPTPSATPDNTAALQRRYEDARKQIVDGKYDAAATALARLVTEAQNRQPLANWARLHLGLAALLQGKMQPARDAFQQIERAGPFSTSKADAELATFFVETAKALAAPGPIRGLPEINPNRPDALGLLLSGIKDWQLREFDEAAGLLERYLNTEPSNEFKWTAEYKPIARKHLEDHRVYAESKSLPQRLNNASEARAAVDKVKALQKRLQTRGVLADALKDEEKRLSRSLSTLEKAENEARERQKAEEFAKRKPEWLAAWKTQLINDLKTGAYRGPITVGATTYDGVIGANEREVTLRVGAYGGAPFAWDKLPPQLLLTIARAFIRPGQGDIADRQWLSAIYAQSTDQADAARELAEEAAKAKPDYREQMRFLFAP
ncbi:MAG TPA: protein kinase, partial [Chthoniobacterales bacterium]